MTNLPDDCQRLLELARDGHDPVDPGPRLRVRQAVAASLALSAAAGGSIAPGALPASQAAASNSQVLSSAAHTTLTGKTGLAVFASKLGAVATAAVAAAGLGYAVYRTQQPAPRAHLPGPSSAEVARASEPTTAPGDQEVRLQLPLEAAAPATSLDNATEVRSLAQGRASTPGPRREVGKERTAHKQRAGTRASAQPRVSTLSSETALLRSASEAIARGDEASALAALTLHAQQFPQGSLREERDGLRAIAECTRDTSPSTASAKRFARAYPRSMLSARVAKACADK